MKPYKKSILIAVAFMLLDVVCEVIQPTLMSVIVGSGIQSGNIGYICGIGALMIALALLAIVAGFGNARIRQSPAPPPTDRAPPTRRSLHRSEDRHNCPFCRHGTKSG
mgnify:CR=1 FL=1